MGIILITLLMTHLTIVSVTLYLHRSQSHRGVEFHPVLAHAMRFWLWLTTGMTTKQWATRPSQAAYTDALKRKVTGYQKCLNFGAVKNAIANGNPVTIGFYVYSSFEGNTTTTTGMMPYPNTNTEQLLGGHAICIVGYDDNLNGGRFICRNSWGTNWGDHGYFYMPYAVIQNPNMSSDFWLISAVKNP